MQHVAAQTSDLEVALGHPAGQLVRAEERRLGQTRGSGDPGPHELGVGDAGGALGEDRQDHETAVVVGESLPGR